MIRLKKFTIPRRARLWTAGILAVCLVFLAIDYFAYPYGAPPTGPTRDTGENGAWLDWTWYSGQQSDAAIDRLAKHLRDEHIRYAYFHIRSVKKDGTLKFHYAAAARHLVARMHKDAPEIKAVAWVYAGNPRGLGAVDLSHADVRRTMTSECRWLCDTCGFDGLQWDYEICANNDRDFLNLLRETRAALPPGKLLSVDTALWTPRPFQGHWGWSADYFADVAKLSDQLCLMCYDSAMYWPRAYVGLVDEETVQVTRAVAHGNPQCRVLIGIPAYKEGGLSHHAHAENMAMALRGVRRGLADERSRPPVFAGVAVFGDYTADARDWAAYNRLWRGE